MNNLNQEAAYQKLQQKNIVNVIPISEFNSLAEICCRKERADDELYKYETFFLNKDNKIVVHFESEESFTVEQLGENCENLFVIDSLKETDKYPYKLVRIEEDGTQTLLNEYENIEFGIEDGCFAVKKDGLWGFIDGQRNEIIKPQYDKYRSFQSGFAIVKKDRLWGLIDKQNNVVVPFKYHYFKDFYGGYAVVVNERWSKELINNKGEIFYKAIRFSNIFNLGNGSILAEDRRNNRYNIVKIGG